MTRSLLARIVDVATESVRRRKRPFLTALAFSLPALFLLVSPAWPHTGTRPDAIVLVINSYHYGYSWSDNEITGIVETFRSQPEHYAVRTEYLDTKFFPGMDLFTGQKNLMVRKYAAAAIPVVIATDNPALEFALKYRAELFPGAAIVFCGINGYDPSMLSGQRKVTGVAERLDTRTTVRLALALHPGTREIFVVHDFTSTGLATRIEAEADLAEFAPRVKIRYMENLGTDDMLLQVKGLKKGAIVLALSYSRDKDGIVYDHTRISRLLGENSPVPVYGTHEERIGYGIIGGSLVGGMLQGSAAAKIALRILKGENADRIPVQTSSPTRLVFDHNKMIKFGISRGDLPRETIIVNEPESFYRKHTGLVWSATGFLSSLILIICLLVLNIRQRRRSELALARKAAQLEQSNLELQAFNVLAYHDLQEPLRSIGSFVQLLEQKYRNNLDMEAREYIGFAVQGVNRMKQLFSDFLIYTAQTRESGRLTTVDLDYLLDRVRQRLQNELSAIGARIVSEPLPRVTGNEQQLELLFQHLIENAIKFRGDAPPLIRVSARPEGDTLRISLSDNGIGIEPEYREQIFRIFERLHHEDRYPGTGIGLAICRKIIGLHDGRIWVDRRAAQEQLFISHYPWYIKICNEISREDPMTISRHPKRIEILLVEDNPADIRLTTEVLKDAKLCNDLQIARDGIEAMQYLLREGKFAGKPRPDLVLLDLNLPRLDGRDVLRKIKGNDDLKRIPVVVLTTSDAEQDILKSYDLHANCYITKPVDLEQFSKVVHCIEDFWFSIVKLPPKE